MPVSNPSNPGQTFNPGQPLPPPGSTPAVTSTGLAVSNQAVKVIGFMVAGAALIALADVAPEAGVGLTAVLGLGVLLMHATQLQQLVNGFDTAIGQPATA